jgi:DNA-binding transcriptional LysR family regulator
VPSAVSQHVSALERHLGGTLLLVRKPGSRLALTAAGRALAAAATELFEATTAFRDVAQQVSRGEGLELRIGSYGTAISHLLPAALARLQECEPRVSVRVQDVEPYDGLPLLERGQLDLLVAHRYLPDDLLVPGKALEVRHLGREPIVLAIASQRTERPVNAYDCQAMDWVAGGEKDADRRLLRRWSHNAGFEPRVRYETRDCHTAVEIIAAGLAVGLLPASVVSASQCRNRLAVVPMPTTDASPSREVLTIKRSGFRIRGIDELLNRMTAQLTAVSGSVTHPGSSA